MRRILNLFPVSAREQPNKLAAAARAPSNPNGTNVYIPYPDYEMEDPPGAGGETFRITYRLAGQMVAVRAAGTLYYTLTDHLGNVMLLTKTDGSILSGSAARYDPFGNYRTWPGSNVNPLILDRGFTGHVHDNTGTYPTQNVGLIYMNARYYLPEVGWFISPDSIVPEPGNPQSYNRYAYTLNNPMIYTDSTGHWVTSSCVQRGCTLGEQINPDVAYQGADGNFSVVDPYLSAKCPSVIAQKVKKVKCADASGVGIMATASLDTPREAFQTVIELWK
jgi:RHS repeat-associated protein